MNTGGCIMAEEMAQKVAENKPTKEIDEVKAVAEIKKAAKKY